MFTPFAAELASLLTQLMMGTGSHAINQTVSLVEDYLE